MSKTPAALSILVCCLSLCARACLRDEIDEKTIQWSNLIVEARLVEVSERVEMKALAVKPPKGAKGGDISAVYWLRVYSFEVQKVIDPAGGSVKPRHRIEVVRFFGKVDDPGAATRPAPASSPSTQPVDPCLRYLTRASMGQTFVLLLRPEQDIKMHKPPVWSDTKNLDPRDAEVHGLRAYAVIHLMLRSKTSEAEMNHLRAVIAQTRAAEKKAPDAEIKKQVEVIVKAASDEEAEPAIAALKKVGYKAVGHVKSARDKKETPPEAKERLAKLAIELSPPPMSILIGEMHE